MQLTHKKKNEINEIRQAATRRKEVKTKKVKRQVIQSDSEEEIENEQKLCQGSDNDEDWYDEEEDEEENILTEDDFASLKAEIGEYVVVIFCTKKLKVYHVAKVLEPINENMKYLVSFLRLKIKQQELFCMPDVADTSFVRR